MSNKLLHDQVIACAAESMAHSYADFCRYAEPSRAGVHHFVRDVAFEAWKLIEAWGRQQEIDYEYDAYKEHEREAHGVPRDKLDEILRQSG